MHADHARHDRIVELLERMLALHRQLAAATTGHEKTLLQRQIDATDRQIDRLVYELHGLTAEEVVVVEGVRGDRAGAEVRAAAASEGAMLSGSHARLRTRFRCCRRRAGMFWICELRNVQTEQLLDLPEQAFGSGPYPRGRDRE